MRKKMCNSYRSCVNLMKYKEDFFATFSLKKKMKLTVFFIINVV